MRPHDIFWTISCTWSLIFVSSCKVSLSETSVYNLPVDHFKFFQSPTITRLLKRTCSIMDPYPRADKVDGLTEPLGDPLCSTCHYRPWVRSADANWGTQINRDRWSIIAIYNHSYEHSMLWCSALVPIATTALQVR